MGFWIGFDLVSNDHQIYWQNKWSVGIESSIRLTRATPVLINDSAMIEEVSFEGRQRVQESDTNNKNVSMKESITKNTIDIPLPTLPATAPTPAMHPSHIQKPLQYVKNL